MNGKEDNKERHNDSFSQETALQWILDVVKELKERNPNVPDCVKTTIDLIERYATDGLAVPKRNCNRFATVKDAAIAFAAECKAQPHPCPDFTFSAWLLARTHITSETGYETL